jgi:hypothetical protein
MQPLLQILKLAFANKKVIQPEEHYRKIPLSTSKSSLKRVYQFSKQQRHIFCVCGLHAHLYYVDYIASPTVLKLFFSQTICFQYHG